jgi:putative ATP-dependent endonuclease of OLD family
VYISKVRIQNYRCFFDSTIEFQPRVNVIIGENNAGKSTILSALRMVFDPKSRPRTSLYDFFQGIAPSKEPPAIVITVTLRSEGEGGDTAEDRALVATWLTKISGSWEAELTYEYALRGDDLAEFHDKVGDTPKPKLYWATIERMLDKYTSKVYGGLLDARNRAEPELLEKLDCKSLDAIRDAASQLFVGSNPLLKRLLVGLLDADLTGPAAEARRQHRKELFRECSKVLAGNLQARINIDQITDVVLETGAADGGNPRLGGHAEESDVLSALRLFVAKQGFELPLDRNGLGYNNLIYISLVIASMDLDTDSKLKGDNAVIFPMLLIEEPEAHLHPALQYKLLKWIYKRVREQKSRQIFITTHSTQITAAADLDSIICMYLPDDEPVPKVAYPGRAFPTEAQASKKYVERYLDATKSNLLFSKAVMFVEGLAEQILLPRLAEYISLDINSGQPVSMIEANHVAVIAVGGSTFKHFLYLFGASCPDEARDIVLKRRVACLLDADPTRRKKNVAKSRFKKCWPYEIDADPGNYDYQGQSGVIGNLTSQVGEDNPHIQILFGTKTLEYDLALANGDNGMLHADMEDVEVDTNVVQAIEAQADHCDALMFATKYLLKAEDSKGENAFDLDRSLRDNLDKPQSERVAFKVPTHIRTAIEWVCQRDGGVS